MVLTVVDLISDSAPLVGGAALTDLAFMRGLTARGFECHIVTDGPARRRTSRAGVPVHCGRDADEVQGIVAALRPHVLFCSLDAILDGVRMGQRWGVPVIAYLHSYEYCPPTPRERAVWKVGKPPRDEAEVRWALSQADAVCANSEFMRRRVLRRYGMEAEVMYPALEPADFMALERRPRFITGLCGYPHKGSAIFEALAQQFPNLEFMHVGPCSPQVRDAFRKLPNVTVRDRDRPHRFLAETRVLVMPSQWAEPFGRVAVEAMANGIPVLASATGGLREVVGDGPLAVRRWHRVASWVEALGRLLGPQERCSGEVGRKRAEMFVHGQSVDQLAALATRLAATARPAWDAAPTVAWRGDRTSATAYAMLNRRWTEGLRRVRVVSDGVVDCTVHHEYRERVPDIAAPSSGALVVARSWDFGPWPPRWVEHVNAACDQLWVYSEHVRRQAITSGVMASRVKVVPPGVDLDVFRPDDAGAAADSGDVRFLFVGGAVRRKGVDVLLAAWEKAFTHQDKVCLVVKDHARDVFYQGVDLAAEVARLAARPGAPRVLHLRAFLTEEELAGLYRSCDVGVFPYRAEGCALPILESMACGLPVIVPRHGPALEHCDRASAWFVKAREMRLPVRGEFSYNSLGMREALDEVAFCEIDPDDLAAVLREAYASKEARRRKGEAAAARARKRHDSAIGLAKMERLLTGLCRRAVPVRVRELRRQKQREARQREAAIAMLARPR